MLLNALPHTDIDASRSREAPTQSADGIRQHTRRLLTRLIVHHSRMRVKGLYAMRSRARVVRESETSDT